VGSNSTKVLVLRAAAGPIEPQATPRNHASREKRDAESGAANELLSRCRNSRHLSGCIP
jgi:hypothetical protein